MQKPETADEKLAAFRFYAACSGLKAKEIERLVADYLKGKST